MSDEKYRILVVDDQVVMLKAVQLMLSEDASFEICTHANSGSALAIASAFDPHLIFLDLNMEPIDGLDLLRQFRQLPHLQRIPVVMLSAAEEAKTKVEAFRLGANDYLVKLPDAIELIARARYHAKGYLAELDRAAAYRALVDSRQTLERQQAQLVAVNHELRESSLTDALTGLRNRRFHRVYVDSLPPKLEPLPMIGERRSSDSVGFSYFIFDLDHFKSVNDLYGHDVGDAVLITVANRLRAQLRADDAAIRWGGEEFLVITRGHDPTAAHHLANKIIKAIAGSGFDVGLEKQLWITCSLGYTCWPWHDGENIASVSHDQAINLADVMAYAAKTQGRNGAFGIFQRGKHIDVARLFAIDVNALDERDRAMIEITPSKGPERQRDWVRLSKITH